MEDIDKKNVFIEFGRSSKTSIGELIISQSLLKNANPDIPKILFEEMTKVEREKILSLRETSDNYPPDYLSANSLAWIKSSMLLPSVCKIIYDNNNISPFKESKNEI